MFQVSNNQPIQPDFNKIGEISKIDNLQEKTLNTNSLNEKAYLNPSEIISIGTKCFTTPTYVPPMIDIFGGPVFNSPNISKALEIADSIVYGNNDKADIIDKANDFHKVIEHMDKHELVELSKCLSNMMQKSNGNEDIIASLEKAVMDEIKEKSNNVIVNVPIPLSSIDKPIATQEELDWATDFQNKVKMGYKPTNQEIEKYEEIYNKFVNQNSPQIGDNNVTKEEINWAKELEKRVKDMGYKPTQREIEIYNNIANRLSIG